MPGPDLLALVRQIHAEAAVLRASAREADVQVAAFVAEARGKRERALLRRERDGSRSRLGEEAGPARVRPERRGT